MLLGGSAQEAISPDIQPLSIFPSQRPFPWFKLQSRLQCGENQKHQWFASFWGKCENVSKNFRKRFIFLRIFYGNKIMFADKLCSWLHLSLFPALSLSWGGGWGALRSSSHGFPVTPPWRAERIGCNFLWQDHWWPDGEVLLICNARSTPINTWAPVCAAFNTTVSLRAPWTSLSHVSYFPHLYRTLCPYQSHPQYPPYFISITLRCIWAFHEELICRWLVSVTPYIGSRDRNWGSDRRDIRDKGLWDGADGPPALRHACLRKFHTHILQDRHGDEWGKVHLYTW